VLLKIFFLEWVSLIKAVGLEVNTLRFVIGRRLILVSAMTLAIVTEGIYVFL
jgi:hypothetical protein